MRRSKLPVFLLLLMVLCAGSAFAASPEAQCPMSPAAAPATLAAPQADALKVLPDPIFLSYTDCVFKRNDCFGCAFGKVKNCDLKNCYNTATGARQDVLMNCTPCANFC